MGTIDDVGLREGVQVDEVDLPIVELPVDEATLRRGVDEQLGFVGCAVTAAELAVGMEVVDDDVVVRSEECAAPTFTMATLAFDFPRSSGGAIGTTVLVAIRVTMETVGAVGVAVTVLI